LFSLSNPKVRLAYVTSMPVSKDIVNYYLEILESRFGTKVADAKSRLLMISC
jgi:hypothetical protein